MKITVIHDPTHPDLQDCPIGAIRATKTIVINPILYYALSDFEQKFWLKHEEGHIVLDTSNEIKADAYAFDKMVATEYRSLKQMVAALENLLSNSPESKSRKKALMKRALEWDKTH